MQLALPLLGAAIAPTFGAAWTTGWLVGSMLYGLVSGPRKGKPTIGETGAQTVQEGAPIPVVFGTSTLTGFVRAAGPIRKVITPIKGGKGGSQKVGEEVQYFCTWALCIGEPIDVLVMVKRDGAIVYDNRPGNDFAEDNAKFLENCKIYYGDENQLPDPDLEAIFGVGEVPSYRGTAYLVFKDDDITSRGGSLPQLEVLVSSNGSMRTVEVTTAVNHSTITSTVGGGINFNHWPDPPYPNFSDSNHSGSGCILFHFYCQNVTLGVTLRFQILGNPGVSQYVIAEEFKTAGTTGPVEFSIQVNHQNQNVPYRGLVAVVDGSQIGSPQTNWVIVKPNSSTWQPVFNDSLKAVYQTDANFGVLTNGSEFRRASYVNNNEKWRPSGPWSYFPEGEVRSVLLSDLVTNIHDRCGAVVPDVSELVVNRLHGVTFGSPDYTGGNAIDALRPLYTFDRVESGLQLRYVKRGKAAVATITEDDLVDLPESSEREAPLEFPRRVLLTALNPSANYETATAQSQRYSPDVRVKGESSVTVPVVLTEEEQARHVSIIHKVLWAEAEREVTFALPYKWIWLTAGDCLILTMRGQSRRVRIEEISDADFVRTIKAKVDRASAYVADPIYAALPTPYPPVSHVVGDTVLAVMDIPALYERDDQLVQYIAVCGGGAAWGGALLQRSLDDGESFGNVDTFGASVMGLLVDAITSSPAPYTDTTNVVRVQLIRADHEISSISESSFLNGGGGFALEKPDGSYEVMQYLDAVDEGSGIFALTTLHRGVLNSKPSAHIPGARFVLLSGASSVPAESSWIGRDLVHRAPSLGQSPEDADQQTEEFVGRSQREWSVASFMLHRSGDDILGSWSPRHRFGSEISPVASINFQGFRITLNDGADVVTFDTTEAGFTYDASALGTPIDVTVAALNRITGLGETTTEEIA